MSLQQVAADIDESTSAIEINADGNVASDGGKDSNANNQRGIFSDIFSFDTTQGKGAALSNLAKNLLTSINKPGAEEDTATTKGGVASLDAVLMAARGMEATVTSQSIPRFISHFEESTSMVKGAFAHVDFSQLSLAALWSSLVLC